GGLEAQEENQKKQKEAFDKRLLELSIKVVTDEEKKLKESYIEKREHSRLDLSKEPFFPFGLGWDLAYHTKLPKFPTVHLPPSKDRQKVPPTPEDLQHLCQKHQPTPVISLGHNREKLVAEGRCLDGSYLTPYCRCDKKCYRFDTSLGDYPPEQLPIWLAYCRQYRQSHCFDIDDLIHGKVFKYKVMKIEKVNCCEATSTYWMTVKVSNLTLGSIETFQIHAGMRWVTNDKIIFCCRPKEEVIIGLPSCEFCFGLLPGNVAEGKEP
ncbi:hypothetical protein MTR67_048327, partial [Solanum verrucosum]